jgi:lipopolysaccharide/colanic/teichoic acid biosynthesis glycosyltransferase
MDGLRRDGSIDKGFKEAKKSLNINGNSTYKVKPGMTGLWQVQGRSEAPFHNWIKYDVKYVKNQSIWLDIRILFKTIKVVFKRMGAC